jgi:hypothetical protein
MEISWMKNWMCYVWFMNSKIDLEAISNWSFGGFGWIKMFINNVNSFRNGGKPLFYYENLRLIYIYLIPQ